MKLAISKNKIGKVILVLINIVIFGFLSYQILFLIVTQIIHDNYPIMTQGPENTLVSVDDDETFNEDEGITTPTPVDFPYVPITSVEDFELDELLTEDKELALDNITKAFNNIQAVDSYGYRLHSHTGDSMIQVDYKAKLEKKKIEYGFSFIFKYEDIYIDVGPTNSYIPYKLWRIDGDEETIGAYLVDHGFNREVVYEHTCGPYEDDYSVPSYHLQSNIDVTYVTYQKKEFKNGIEGVEYIFHLPNEYSLNELFRVHIGVDGLIYLIQIPCYEWLTEYADFEYNVAYNLSIDYNPYAPSDFIYKH